MSNTETVTLTRKELQDLVKPSGRRAVQIQSCLSADGRWAFIYQLANDGTAWGAYWDTVEKGADTIKWEQLPPLPQPDPEKQ